MTAFQQHIDSVVADFLETALVVDDEGLPTVKVSRESLEEAAVPVRSRSDLTLDTPPEPELAAAQQTHPLDTKALMDAFAEMGIVCSVLAPLKGDQIQERVLKAAARSDLLILDWELHRDGGQTARELIQAVLNQDAEGDRRRLRVIAIYTGELGLKRIIERIRKDLRLTQAAKQDDGMSLAQTNVRIAAFTKRGAGPSRPELATAVTEADLPSRLATVFAELTDGLVPAVALAGLASIRSDTHRILQALREDMDIGYLGHRVASSFPEDAEGHLVDIVSSEISSVLNDADIGAYANIDIIREWLNRAREDPGRLKCGSALDQPKSISNEQIEKMLTVGLGLDEELGQHTAAALGEKALKRMRAAAARLFTNDAVTAEASADLFGMRMATRTLYTRPRRVLRLGTIALHRGEYLVCVQPRCDSVRLIVGEPRNFPFLPLKVVPSEASRHSFVVRSPDDAGLVRLRLEAKPFALKTWPFKCGVTRTIEAKTVSGMPAFYNTSNHRFVWVADLKPDFAQRVAVELGAELARVGLSESELIRLSGS